MNHALAAPTESRPSTPRAYRDWLGVAASVGCAIHCAAMPFVVGFLPLLGLSFLAEPIFHKWMVGICLALALAAFIPGWRRHRDWSPGVIGICGLTLISMAAFASPYDCCPSVACVTSGDQNVSMVQPAAAGSSSASGTPCCPSEEGAAGVLLASTSETALADESVCTSASCGSASAAMSATAAPGEPRGLIAMMWALMTPLGGVFLVAGHLCNRHLSGRCAAGCCGSSAYHQDPA